MDHKVNIFSQIPIIEQNRNLFERNHQWKGTLDGGYLYPVFCEEVLPGDTKKLNTTFFGRMTTPVVPIMDNIYLDYHLWFIPRRLVWENWDKFLGARENPDDSIDYLIPQVESGANGYPRYSYFDYFGIRTATGNLSTDACYYRSLIKVWNDWYRDQNLQASIPLELGDGPDDLSLYTNFNYGSDGVQNTQKPYLLLKRGKRQDYFTTCLPSPQKGEPVDIALTGNIPVVGNGMAMGLTDGSKNFAHVKSTPNNFAAASYSTAGFGQSIGYSAAADAGNLTTGKAIGLTSNPDKSGLIALLSDASAVTINSLRNSIALQQFLETDNIYGTRTVELILGHFGVRIPDYRLQRPEYLGGGTSRININPVAQTSSTDSTSPQGNLGAFGTLASTGNGFAQSFVEHGIIIGLVSIRTDLNYQQGIPRQFSRKTRYDFFWPLLAHLGNQPVYNKEIFAQGTDEDDDIFGYQERYAEYRYKENIITGKFRSDDPNSLDVWHLAQDFAELPQLNAEFIEENPPFSRVLAVQDEPQFLLDCYHEFDDIREVPLYGNPGLRRI